MENKKRHRFLEQFIQLFRKKTATVLDLDSKLKTTRKERSVKRNPSLSFLRKSSNASIQSFNPTVGSSESKDLQKLDYCSTRFQISELNGEQQLDKSDRKITALERSPRRQRQSCFIFSHENSETNVETGRLSEEANIRQYSFIDQEGLTGRDCIKPGKRRLCRSHFDVRNRGETDGLNIRSIASTVKPLGKVTAEHSDISQNPLHDSGFDQNTCVATDLKLEAGPQCVNKGYPELNVSIRDTWSRKFGHLKSPWSQSSSSSFEDDEDDDLHVKRIVRRTRSQRDLRHRRLSNILSGTVDGLSFMSRRRMNSSEGTERIRSQSAEVLEQWKTRVKLRESLPGVPSEMHSAVRRRGSLPRFAGKTAGCSTTRNRDSMYTGTMAADESVPCSLARRAKSTNHLDRRRCPASSHPPPPPYPLHCRASSIQSPPLDRDARLAICHFSALQHPRFNGE